MYVDDIVLVGSNEKEIDSIVKKLAEEFPLRDLGILRFFLSI